MKEKYWVLIFMAVIPAGLRIQMNEWTREPDLGNMLTETQAGA